jgi:hypothetical protein
MSHMTYPQESENKTKEKVESVILMLHAHRFFKAKTNSIL